MNYYILAYTNEDGIDVRILSDNQVVQFIRRFLFDIPEDITTVTELSDYYYQGGEFEDYGSTRLTLTDENGTLILRL